MTLEELIQQREKLKHQLDVLNRSINALKLEQVLEKEILRQKKELARECSLDVKEEIWYSILAGRYNVQETGCSFHCATYEISTEKYKVEITLEYDQDLLELTLDEFLKQQVKFVNAGEEDAD